MFVGEQQGTTTVRWGFLFATTLGRACVGFQFQALPALAPALAASLGLGLAEIGTLTGLYMLPGVAVALVGGALLQRFAVRTVLALSLVAMTLSGVASFLAADLGGQMLSRLLGGVGGVLFIVATLKGLYDHFPATELSLANGISSAAHPFGMGSALVIFSAMGHEAAWQFGLLTTGAVSMVTLVALLAVTKKTTVLRPREPRPFTLRLPRHELTMVMLAGCVLGLYAGSFHAFLSIFPSYLSASQWPPRDTASVMAVLGWAPIVMAPLGGLLVARFGGSAPLIAICILVWGGSTVALPLLGISPWLIGLMVVFGPLVMGPVFSLGAEAVSPERRGIGSGIFMSGFFLGNAALPAAAAWVGERIPGTSAGGEATAVVFCGLAFLCALVPFLMFKAMRAKLDRAKARPNESL